MSIAEACFRCWSGGCCYHQCCCLLYVDLFFKYVVLVLAEWENRFILIRSWFLDISQFRVGICETLRARNFASDQLSVFRFFKETFPEFAWVITEQWFEIEAGLDSFVYQGPPQLVITQANSGKVSLKKRKTDNSFQEWLFKERLF